MSLIGAIGSAYSAYNTYPNFDIPGVTAPSEAKPILNPNESTQKVQGKRSSPAECETCRNRKYQDGSDEMVSFKSAQHISPESAAARVRGHEQEHVSNAYKDAAMNNGKVLQASVSIKTAICPECGRSYICGGETATMIKYSEEGKDNPYQKERKALDRQAVLGANMDEDF
ncbi:hypothetical protein [Butyrivibrio sp. YAB3001]|uniref:hypothetical protein n=1 Tax=Butyrivibrio sp. YAB3001 TaxID=1520812 RepID=UPI0008F68082|nr:hypothetical protein [Butyrivibrio sp. YAB3001]SFC20261.1 hypothetical protein SAMN02910398_01731 [Butyrivibrio sp. YAB3001]